MDLVPAAAPVAATAPLTPGVSRAAPSTTAGPRIRPASPAAEDIAASTRVDEVNLSIPTDPRQALDHLESLRREALDPAHPDPQTAAALARAIAHAQEEIRREEAEARRREAQQEEARQARRGGAPDALPAMPAEALRPLTGAERLRRAAVEGAYLAGDLKPGGLGISVEA